MEEVHSVGFPFKAVHRLYPNLEGPSYQLLCAIVRASCYLGGFFAQFQQQLAVAIEPAGFFPFARRPGCLCQPQQAVGKAAPHYFAVCASHGREHGCFRSEDNAVLPA